MDRKAEVRRRIRRWRELSPAYARMPEELWKAAVSLARGEGAYAISRELGVRYATLKRRLSESATGDGGRTAQFVELDTSRVFGGTVVELERSDGTKLTVRLGGGERLDIAALASAFVVAGV